MPEERTVSRLDEKKQRDGPSQEDDRMGADTTRRGARFFFFLLQRLWCINILDNKLDAFCSLLYRFVS